MGFVFSWVEGGKEAATLDAGERRKVMRITLQSLQKKRAGGKPASSLSRGKTHACGVSFACLFYAKILKGGVARFARGFARARGKKADFGADPFA